jgi:hypothetical protein
MLPSLSKSSVLPLSVLVSVSPRYQHMSREFWMRSPEICRTENEVQSSCLLCGKSHASRDNEFCIRVDSAHHSELACAHEVGKVFDFLLEGRVLLVLLGISAKMLVLTLHKLIINTHGSAALDPVSALENDMLLAGLLFVWVLGDECFEDLAVRGYVAGEGAKVKDLESVDANGRTDVAILRRAELETKHSDAVCEDGSDAVMRGIALLIAGESGSSRSISGLILQQLSGGYWLLMFNWARSDSPSVALWKVDRRPCEDDGEQMLIC